MSDSDQIDAMGILSMNRSLFQLYSALHTTAEAELMKLDQNELKLLKLLYADQLVYPIADHIDQLLDGAPPSETIH